jgi:hypothetical protein
MRPNFAKPPELSRSRLRRPRNLRPASSIARSSIHRRTSAQPPRTIATAPDLTHYSHYLTRRLGAEQLLDALSQVTQTPEVFASSIPEPFTRLPRDIRAVQIADGSITTPFLDLFGRPPRDTAYDRDRCNDTSVQQALHL